MRRPLAALAAAAVAFAACEPSPTSSVDIESAPSVVSMTAVADGRIAFVRVERADIVNTEIYLVNPDGSGLTNLTNNPANDEDPAWSPDGRRIAFTRQSDLHVMNADGSGQTHLTTLMGSEFDATWSPDGRRIAFVNANGSESDILVMNADGSGISRLTDYPGQEREPAWSPDGTKIAFTCACGGGSSLDIWVMNSDGRGLTNLTSDAPGVDNHPAWSPDGQRIAFRSLRGFDESLYVMGADGSDPVHVFNCYHDGCEHPTWSLDGTRLAYVWDRDIWVGELATGGLTQLTGRNAVGFGVDSSPAWGVTPTRTVVERFVLLAVGVVRLQQSGALDAGQALALNLKLKFALEAWRGGRPDEALPFMAAFVRQVADLVETGVLTPADSQPLIALAIGIVQRMFGLSGQSTGASG